MLSRNRSTCGVRPYIRATTNPDADSWVREFIAWWIGEDGLPIERRCGSIRWFIVRDDSVIWADSEKELTEQYGEVLPKSFTFINAKLDDNKILQEKDPTYRANIEAQNIVERARLGDGNWNVRPASGMYFKRHFFNVVDSLPHTKPDKIVRAWDLAATEKREDNDPDYTVGLKGEKHGNDFYITDMVRMQSSSATVERSLLSCANSDGRSCKIRLPQDPGQAGKAQALHFTNLLAGHPLKIKTVTGDKVTRSSIASSQAEQGNIYVLRAAWNDSFFSELEGFPEAKHDDIVDALSDLIEELSNSEIKPIIAAVGGTKSSARF